MEVKQRRNAPSTNELKKYIDNCIKNEFNVSINMLQTDNTNIKNKIEQILLDRDDINSSIRDIQSQRNELNTSFNNLNVDKEEMLNINNELQTSNREILSKVLNLETTKNQIIQNMADNMLKQSSNYDVCTSQFTEFKSEITNVNKSMETRIKSIENNVKVFLTRVDSIDKNIKDHITKSVKIESTVSDLCAKFTKLRTSSTQSISECKKNAVDLATNINKMQSRMTKLDGELQAFKNQMTANNNDLKTMYDNKIAKINSRIDSEISRQNTSNITETKDIVTKIDKHSNTISHLNNKIDNISKEHKKHYTTLESTYIEKDNVLNNKIKTIEDDISEVGLLVDQLKQQSYIKEESRDVVEYINISDDFAVGESDIYVFEKAPKRNSIIILPPVSTSYKRQIVFKIVYDIQLDNNDNPINTHTITPYDGDMIEGKKKATYTMDNCNETVQFYCTDREWIVINNYGI